MDTPLRSFSFEVLSLNFNQSHQDQHLFSKVKKSCTIILFYIILHLIYSLFLLLWYLYYWVINNYAMAGWGASLCLCESLANAKRNTL